MTKKSLQFSTLLETLKESLEKLPEHRSGENTTYELKDAGLAAFGVFFTQSSSFLAYQRDIKRRKGHNNAEGVFGVERIPSDEQIRNLLDPVNPARLREPFWTVYECLAAAGYLERHRGVNGTRLVSVDGTQYFSSQKIHCDNCRVTRREVCQLVCLDYCAHRH